MNVPRGTPPLQSLTRGHVTTYFKLRPAFLTAWERDALAVGAMRAARWPITNSNASLDAGKFADLDFDSGRAVRGAGLVELRCRCRFRSGAVRVAKVMPAICEGDLFWVRDGDAAGARKNSRFVLEVTGVDVARLQDMSDADALDYGAACIPDKLKKSGNPRIWFARDRGQFWNRNGWQWVVSFTTHRANIDEYLAGRRA